MKITATTTAFEKSPKTTISNTINCLAKTTDRHANSMQSLKTQQNLCGLQPTEAITQLKQRLHFRFHSGVTCQCLKPQRK